MIRARFTKFYYPGLISLLLLPALCVGYLYYEGIVTKYFATDLVWINSAEFNKYPVFHNSHVFQNKNYQDLKIDGTSKQNDLKIKSISVLINSLVNKKDDANGIRVTFGAKANYANLVDLIDICNRIKEPNFNYLLVDDQLLMIYHTPMPVINTNLTKPNEVILFMCGTGLLEKYEENRPMARMKQSFVMLKRDMQATGLNVFWLYFSALLWLVMLFTAFKKYRIKYSQVN